MNTKQIEYILTLAETENFNRAAERLFVSQPTMTYQIKAAEDEIGFALFDRSQKGVTLTPAGVQFCITLRNIQEELKNAIEQGQNFSSKYKEDITLSMPVRSAIGLLPDAIREFSKTRPEVSVTPKFQGNADRIDDFLRGKADILFTLLDEVKHLPDVIIHPLYTSGIYLISELQDPLAGKQPLKEQDLSDRTLMVGGGSPPALRSVQQRIIARGDVQYFNSADHSTTLTNVAAGKGICLAPGFLNDHTGEFAWTRFECAESFQCVLCTHKKDTRSSVKEFVELLQQFYQSASDGL